MKLHKFENYQAGGLTLIVAMVIMFAGAVVANFTLAQSNTNFGAAPEQMLAAIAANPAAWRLADTLILAAIILTALGLVPVTASFSGPGRSWAWVGLATFFFAAVFGAIRRIVSISLEPWVAVSGLDIGTTAVAAFDRFGEGLGEWFTVLAFTAVALFGIAWSYRPDSRLIGWLFAVGGAGGILIHFVGAGIPAFIFLATGALGAVIFMRGRPAI